MRTTVTLVAVAVFGVIGILSTTSSSVHAAGRALPTPPSYVALGDSIASGAGLPFAANAGDSDIVCSRSPQAYPTVLAAKLNTQVKNLACSGAKDSDGIINAQLFPEANITVPSQLDRAFENGVPNLVTMTIGANDIRWTQFIGKCYVSECGTVTDTAASAAYLTYFQGKLAYTLREIKARSGSATPPKVLITGYYNPVSSTSCLNNTVSPTELRWINAQTDNLNKAIKQTVTATTKISSWFKGTYNFATYVPISFSGHGLCSSDPWVQGLNDGAPIHPNSTGATAIANTLYRYAR